jgi:hypothetical protein
VVIAADWFVAVVLDAETHSSNALLALSILLWGGLALGCGWLLVRQPPAPEPGDRWLQSLRKRALRAAFVMAAVGLVALTGLVLKLSYSAVVLNFG